MKFKCENCSQKLEADKDLKGSIFECPKCGVSVCVPERDLRVIFVGWSAVILSFISIGYTLLSVVSVLFQKTFENPEGYIFFYPISAISLMFNIFIFYIGINFLKYRLSMFRIFYIIMIIDFAFVFFLGALLYLLGGVYGAKDAEFGVSLAGASWGLRAAILFPVWAPILIHFSIKKSKRQNNLS